MRCLKCWTDINEKTAYFTKSCSHVFCSSCGKNAFKKELACPLCDTVLPKDGVGTIMVKPNSIDIKSLSSRFFGFEPHQMCEVLQNGLEFWSVQRQNESLRHVQELKSMKQRINESEVHSQKLSRALEDERLKRKALQDEKENLLKLVSELETRYAEKARSMRKLSDLYNELRQVHRKLEDDLRGVRGTDEYDRDVHNYASMEIKTARRSVNALGEDIRDEKSLEEESNRDKVEPESQQLIRNNSTELLKRRGSKRSDAMKARNVHVVNSGIRPNAFSLAPNRRSRSSFEGRRKASRESTYCERDERRYNENEDDNVQEGRSERRLTTRISRHDRY